MNNMSKVEILKTYYDPIPEYKNHFVIVELKVNDKEVKKKVLIDDALEYLISFPPKEIPDRKLFRKCEEMALEMVLPKKKRI